MADTITFRGTTLLDSGDNGVGWSFEPGSLVERAIENEAEVGVGTWIKPGGVPAATHTLDLAWVTATPGTIKAAVVALATVDLGELVLPIWGSFANCRLSNVGNWKATPSDGATGYTLEVQLTFTEYP